MQAWLRSTSITSLAKPIIVSQETHLYRRSGPDMCLHSHEPSPGSFHNAEKVFPGARGTEFIIPQIPRMSSSPNGTSRNLTPFFSAWRAPLQRIRPYLIVPPVIERGDGENSQIVVFERVRIFRRGMRTYCRKVKISARTRDCRRPSMIAFGSSGKLCFSPSSLAMRTNRPRTLIPFPQIVRTGILRIVFFLGKSLAHLSLDYKQGSAGLES